MNLLSQLPKDIDRMLILQDKISSLTESAMWRSRVGTEAYDPTLSDAIDEKARELHKELSELKAKWI